MCPQSVYSGLCLHLVVNCGTTLTTNSSLPEDLELRLAHCDELLACALLSSALILSSATSSTLSALRKMCESYGRWDMSGSGWIKEEKEKRKKNQN